MYPAFRWGGGVAFHQCVRGHGWESKAAGDARGIDLAAQGRAAGPEDVEP